MDLMSFILGGMFVADVLDEYDIQRKEQEILEDYLYEIEHVKECFQDFGEF